MCIKLNDHYNVTDSESITCHGFCIALICWNYKVPATAVTNDRVSKTYNSAVLAVAH